MEKRLNKKIELYVTQLKDDMRDTPQEKTKDLSLMQHIWAKLSNMMFQ